MVVTGYCEVPQVSSSGSSNGLSVIIANTPDIIEPTRLGKTGLTMTINGATTNVRNFNSTVAEYVDPTNYSSPVTSFCSGTWLSGFENSTPEPNGTQLIPITNIPYTFSGSSGGKYYNGSEAIFEYTAYMTVEVVTESGLNPPIKGGYLGENNFFDTKGDPNNYIPGGAGQDSAHPVYLSPLAGGFYSVDRAQVGIGMGELSSDGLVAAGGSGYGQSGHADGEQNMLSGYILEPHPSEVAGALCMAVWDTTPSGGAAGYRTNTMDWSQTGIGNGTTQVPWSSPPCPSGFSVYKYTPTASTHGPFASITTSICPTTYASASVNAIQPFSSWPEKTQVLGESSSTPVDVSSTIHIVAESQSINKTQQYPVTFTYANGSTGTGYVEVQAVSAVVGFGANGLNYILQDGNYSAAIPNMNSGNKIKLYSQRDCQNYFNSISTSVTNASATTTTPTGLHKDTDTYYSMTPTAHHEIVSGTSPVALTGSVEVYRTALASARDSTHVLKTASTSMPRSALGAGITPNIYDITNNCGLPTTLTITANHRISPAVDCGLAYAHVNSTTAEQIGSFWYGATNEWYISNYSQDVAWVYAASDTNWCLAQNFTFPVTIFSERNYQCFSSSGHPIDLYSIVNMGNNSIQNNPLLDDLKVLLWTPVINGSALFNFVLWWDGIWAALLNFLLGLGQYAWIIILLIAVVCLSYFMKHGGSKSTIYVRS